MVVLFPVGSILLRVLPGRLAVWVHGVFQYVKFELFISPFSYLGSRRERPAPELLPPHPN